MIQSFGADGAATQLVLSCGHGVDGFTLQPSGQKSLEER
jgi:fructose-1,6-bisphosphatase